MKFVSAVLCFQVCEREVESLLSDRFVLNSDQCSLNFASALRQQLTFRLRSIEASRCRTRKINLVFLSFAMNESCISPRVFILTG